MSLARWRRWIAVAIILVLALLVYRGVDGASWIYYYRVIDDHTLVLGTTTGSGAWTRVTNVVETPSTITITVQSLLIAPWPSTAVGVSAESVATLRGALGDRVVLDGSSGLTVQGTRCLPPAYFAPGCTLSKRHVEAGVSECSLDCPSELSRWH